MAAIKSFNSSTIHLNSNYFLKISTAILLILTPISYSATSKSQSQPKIVKSLPGYPGELPFRLETGYVGVGEKEQVQLFYYFIESERDPEGDPLMIWLTGGPGCSAFSGLVIEIGPLTFNWQSIVPELELNPYSWTKVASIIFLDSPVGTGFSYATTSEGYYSDDITSSQHIYEFLRKWLMDHIRFQNNPLYITGDSYSGINLPVVVQEIVNGNKVGFEPVINLKGYILGNPVTVMEDLTRIKFEYCHRVSLLSDELYESTKISCNESYDDVDPGNLECHKNLNAVWNCIGNVFTNHVLEPAPLTPHSRCRENNYRVTFIWANNLGVREALNIREGTKIHWTRCNKTLAYTSNVRSSFGYHQNLTKESISALIYSGDQDMIASYESTLGWIKKLNVSITSNWRPWFVEGQVAGYTTKFSNGHYNLTFATVKGGGHTAPEYKPQECLDMIMRWLAMDPL